MFRDYPMDKICEVAFFGSKVRSIALTGFHAEGSDPTLSDSLNEGCRRTPEFRDGDPLQQPETRGRINGVPTHILFNFYEGVTKTLLGV